jgi:benzoate/toluate 1,2-dioxygenase beta subunit
VPADRAEIEQFLYKEARLLDTQQLEAWLDLFTEDACYWVPAGRDDIDPTRHVSIIHDDKAAMARRIKRLRSGHAYAQDPASRVHRIISNVEFTQADPVNRLLEVNNMMLLVELARHRQTIHSARCEFSLERQPQGLRIKRKKVNLLKNNEALCSTPFLI